MKITHHHLLPCSIFAESTATPVEQSQHVEDALHPKEPARTMPWEEGEASALEEWAEILRPQRHSRN